MRVLIGVIAVLLLALGWSRYELAGSESAKAQGQRDLAVAQGALAGAVASLGLAENQNAMLHDRLGNLDLAVKGLAEAQQRNQHDLAGRLEAIRSITQEPGDSDASISCLDVRVPAQLDRSLR